MSRLLSWLRRQFQPEAIREGDVIVSCPRCQSVNVVELGPRGVRVMREGRSRIIVTGVEWLCGRCGRRWATDPRGIPELEPEIVAPPLSSRDFNRAAEYTLDEPRPPRPMGLPRPPIGP